MIAAAALVIVSPSVTLAQERLVHHEIDRGANAIVRVFKTGSGGRIEVDTPAVTLTKSIAGSRVVTTMRDGRDELVVTMDEKTVMVATRVSRIEAARTDRQRLEGVRSLVAASSAGRKAAELIGRLGLGSATPIQPVLLTTRLFVLAASGELDTEHRELDHWIVAATRKPVMTMTKVAFQEGQSKSMTPTECWEAYTKEAIAAFMEYEDCMKNLSWWEVIDAAACAAIYDMRAIGAFSWWLKCVALN